MDSWRRPALFLASAALALLFLEGISQRLHADPDMWHEMALAREIVATRRIPDHDVFAYTPTLHPVVHHEWGMGLLVYSFVQAAGESGVLALFYLLVSSVAFLGVLALRRSGAPPALALVCSPIAIFLSWIGFTLVRAQMATLLFLALLLCQLWRERQGVRSWMRWWIPVTVLWQNMHAGFVVGVGFLLLHAMEQAARRRPWKPSLALFVLGLVLVPLNPWGLHYYAYLARALTLPRPAIGEWEPVTRAFLPIALMWGFSLVLCLYCVARSGWRRCEGLGIVLASALAAGLHQRHLSIYALAWFAHVPSWLQHTPAGEYLRSRIEGRTRRVAWISMLVIAGCAYALSRHSLWTVGIPANRGEHRLLVYPVGAVEHLADAAFEGNLLVPFTYGGYVSYHLHPRVRVSIDSRYEVAYPDGALEHTQALYRAEPGWRDALRLDGTDAVLAPVDAALASALAEDPEWRLAYQDAALPRRPPGGRLGSRAPRDATRRELSRGRVAYWRSALSEESVRAWGACPRRVLIELSALSASPRASQITERSW
jgi:hypothetical protein